MDREFPTLSGELGLAEFTKGLSAGGGEKQKFGLFNYPTFENIRHTLGVRAILIFTLRNVTWINAICLLSCK